MRNPAAKDSDLALRQLVDRMKDAVIGAVDLPDQSSSFLSHVETLYGGGYAKDGLLKDDWMGLLCCEESAELSLQKSQEEANAVHIKRTYDVDSVFVRLTSLAALRGGFELHYCPSYLRAIRQNLRIRSDRYERIHKMKQLRLGMGVAGKGYLYGCHIIFPAMLRTDDNHLSKLEEQIWTDEILIPSIKEVCPDGIIQHHPASFAEAVAKASAKRELISGRSGAPIDYGTMIPESYLDRLWGSIVRRCGEYHDRRRNQYSPFADPLLIVMGHGLKLLFKDAEFENLKTRFGEHVASVFREEHIAPGSVWVDFACEDMAVATEPLGHGVTLIRKRGCCEELASKYADPMDGGKYTKEWYPLAGLRDTGSISADPRKTNRWAADCGVGYLKAYNVMKEPFSCPIKNMGFFDAEQVENLAFTNEELGRIGQASIDKGAYKTVQSRGQLKKSYLYSKKRFYMSIDSAKNKSFGVRLEIRIKHETFISLQAEDVAGQVGDLNGTYNRTRVRWHRVMWACGPQC